MYYSQNELINFKLLADKAMLDSKIIQDLIVSDKLSATKSNIQKGVNYYNARHDILDYVPYYWIDGKQETDNVKTNNKVPHPFLTTLINQKNGHILGKPMAITIVEPYVEDEDNPTPKEQAEINANEEFQTAINEFLGDDFNDFMTDAVEGTSKKGVEWIHFYIDKEGLFQYIINPAQEIIPIYDTQYKNKLKYIIRYYTVEAIDPVEKKTLTRYKVEWWTDKDVTYWEQNSDGNFVFDANYDTNPMGHWQTWNTLSPSKKENHGWGRLPFVPIFNNSSASSDLLPIKELIDGYDKVKSGWLNDLEDFDKLIYVFKNYQGMSAEARRGYSEIAFAIKNLKTLGGALVDGDGGIDTIKAEIPVDAKDRFLQITRKEIFYFGEGIDITNEVVSASPSGVSLKILYAPLDNKCNRLIIKLKKALREFMWFVCEYLNMTENKKYDYTKILFTINKATIFNETEIITNLVSSEGMLSKKTILERHPYVDSPDEEMARIEAERKRDADAGYVDLDKVPDVKEESDLDNPDNEEVVKK